MIIVAVDIYKFDDFSTAANGRLAKSFQAKLASLGEYITPPDLYEVTYDPLPPMKATNSEKRK